MQCERAQEFFSEYLERTLDRPMTVALESHLAGCGNCREEVEALQATCLALSALPEVEPPKDGAWQVMSALRNLRAEEYEAARAQPRRNAFADWVRSLNPFSVAVGASLATLIIGGTFFVGSLNHVQLGFWPGGERKAPAAPEVTTSAMRVSFGPSTPTMKQVLLELRLPQDLPNAQIEVTGPNLPLNPTLTGRVEGGEWTPLAPVQVPVNGQPAAEPLKVRATSSSTGQVYEHLLVVPVGPRRTDSVTLAFSGQRLETGLQQLAPYLSLPVLVDGGVDGLVSLRADEQSPRRCLEALAQQVNAVVTEEHGVYRLSPR